MIRASAFVLILCALGVFSPLTRADGTPPPPPIVTLGGGFSSSLSWTSDPDTGDDVLRGYVQFDPQSSATECKSIRFIQVARVETSPGKDYVWLGSEANRDLMMVQGHYVDHDASKCAPGSFCSPYFRDSWPNSDESRDGSNTPASRVSASMIDYPYGWTDFERITLESCARCVDSGAFYGCVHWGADWPETGNRTLIEPTYSPAPSATFLAALDSFLRFYKMK